MKQLILSILLLVGGVTASAQQDTTRFLFKDYQESLVYYLDGRVFGVKINYDLMQNAFMFIDVNDNNNQKIFAEPDKVRSIKTGNRTFLLTPRRLPIEVLQWEPYIAVQYRGKARPEGKQVAYGGRSETSAVDSYSSFQSGGQQYNLESQKIILTGIDLRYTIKQKGKEKSFISPGQFYKLYPKNKRDSIQQYMKSERIRFDQPDKVVKLVNYAESLK